MGWVARTRPLAGPLSPRGPQPIEFHLIQALRFPQWPNSPTWRGTAVLVLWPHPWLTPCALSITIKMNPLQNQSGDPLSDLLFPPTDILRVHQRACQKTFVQIATLHVTATVATPLEKEYTNLERLGLNMGAGRAPPRSSREHR